jgi:hypothetical protein
VGLFFQTRPGSYNAIALIGFLNDLKWAFSRSASHPDLGWPAIA